MDIYQNSREDCLLPRLVNRRWGFATAKKMRAGSFQVLSRFWVTSCMLWVALITKCLFCNPGRKEIFVLLKALDWIGIWVLRIPASKIIKTQEVFFLSKSSRKVYTDFTIGSNQKFSTLLFKVLTYLTPSLYVKLTKEEGSNMKTDFKNLVLNYAWYAKIFKSSKLGISRRGWI